MTHETEQPGRCFLCGQASGTAVLNEGAYTARQCQCGLVYSDPQPGIQAVDPTVDHHNRLYYSGPAQRRLKWLSRFVKSGRILDVGCGEGEFAQVAKRAGYDVEGVEPDRGRAEVASRCVDIKVTSDLIEEAQLEREYFDGVFHVDLLSHFADPVMALRKMSAAMKPDGVMCFEVGLFGNLSPRWRRWAGRGNMPDHRWFYDEGSLEILLVKSGFEIVELKRFSIGLSTVISTLGVKLRPPAELAAGHGSLSSPLVRGKFASVYYRLHNWLRYDLGSVLSMGGPKVAFVAARKAAP